MPTAVETNVENPTDSGLLAKAVPRIAGTAKRVQAAGGRRARYATGVGRPAVAGDGVLAHNLVKIATLAHAKSA
ncbi:hypothetical protein BJ970_007531 [Saccharopolyspora phatthalungensis]|uniref:Uncharacterized protein n=1 Tax=Saccharopolyspora phatthalungensis TaxID=664693 RepID=A0A840QI42_9PSEU|nr:hypothetical protein [Saccharopolyspora phatthalungensis]